MFILSNYQLCGLDDINYQIRFEVAHVFFFSLSLPGHYVGMDVHDCTMVSYDRPLKPGVVSSLLQ